MEWILDNFTFTKNYCIFIHGLTIRSISCHEGILTCGYGKEEKDAAEMPWHGMVDEEKAAALSFKTKSSPFWTPEMGSLGRRRRDGNDQRLAWRAEEGHQAFPLPRPH